MLIKWSPSKILLKAWISENEICYLSQLYNNNPFIKKLIFAINSTNSETITLKINFAKSVELDLFGYKIIKDD